jgi:hypothetical protein
VLPSQEIWVFLNNALKAEHQLAELDQDMPLPEAGRDMPDQVSGRFVALESSTAHDIEVAWKRVMILNSTQVLYTFTFDPQTAGFTARKR